MDKRHGVVGVLALLHALEALDIALGADLWGVGKDRQQLKVATGVVRLGKRADLIASTLVRPKRRLITHLDVRPDTRLHGGRNYRTREEKFRVRDGDHAECRLMRE